MNETILRFRCFGAHCAIYAGGRGGGPDTAPLAARALLLHSHQVLSRFLPASELSRLNADPREIVPASHLMLRFASAAVEAARLSRGLVDPTLIGPLERAGYAASREDPEPVPLAEVLGASPRRLAQAHPDRAWAHIHVDWEAETIGRPAGVKLDSGGVAKGLMADIAGGLFASHSGWAVDCAGDIRIGGAARRVAVDDPFGRGLLDEFEIADGAIATSGIGKRSWMNADGRPAHHLLDPSTGLPAYSGIVQATALAPTALEAEVLAKAALLSGPERAPGWLRHGGLIVLDDASHVRVPEAVFSGTSQPGLKVPLAPAPSLAS